MDSRTTLTSNETFTEILSTCKKRNEKVAMLVDQDGITRIEGLIKDLVTDTAAPYIELDNGEKITLKSIVAVNGVFLPTYSEC